MVCAKYQNLEASNHNRGFSSTPVGKTTKTSRPVRTPTITSNFSSFSRSYPNSYCLAGAWQLRDSLSHLGLTIDSRVEGQGLETLLTSYVHLYYFTLGVKKFSVKISHIGKDL